MRRLPRARTEALVGALLGACLLLAGSAAFAAGASGRVVDKQKRPIAEAQVCYMANFREETCVQTDAEGRFELPPSQRDRFRVYRAGYLPQTLPPRDYREPIVLERSASLRIHVKDAETGEPLPHSRGFVIYPSGRRRPFVANAQGSRVGTLNPGPAQVQGQAEGYEDGAVVPIELVGGVESTVVIELRRIPPE